MKPGLVIGIVNSLPKAAARTAAADYTALLTQAAPGLNLHLRHFAPMRVPQHESLDALWTSRIDGLIITGAEPVGGSMQNEPYWPLYARLTDWAAAHTISTIWSCLAAQAAVFRLDGLDRQTLPRKLSGVFDCARSSTHRFVSDAPRQFPVPHSRHNTLDANALAATGYEILSHAPRVGPDMFTKLVGGSLFLFMLGHPEYGADQLRREYRRDVRRFLLRESEFYPPMPEGYFEPEATLALEELRQEMVRNPRRDLLSLLDATSSRLLPQTWRPHAIRLFGQWLSTIVEQKSVQARLEAA
jgi:homoserine O-succinyltransferase